MIKLLFWVPTPLLLDLLTTIPKKWYTGSFIIQSTPLMTTQGQTSLAQEAMLIRYCRRCSGPSNWLLGEAYFFITFTHRHTHHFHLHAQKVHEKFCLWYSEAWQRRFPINAMAIRWTLINGRRKKVGIFKIYPTEPLQRKSNEILFLTRKNLGSFLVKKASNPSPNL